MLFNLKNVFFIIELACLIQFTNLGEVKAPIAVAFMYKCNSYFIMRVNYLYVNFVIVARNNSMYIMIRYTSGKFVL